ncbi:PREDICTED: dynamin-related protein 3B isoform X2 [Camelina sativa]|uniref:Dynamin-related protein 3B isoform X1 n=1 Tax=Camelina sativa TaxID=90675 RepID=A0ABM1QBU5_CAMSA|nr:PREDICTED: dynamin-related protein 3B isoform X1 [Camelina sativa]XP_010518222.1 PREDICTED: dynamin-related protein 3B isoform X3 [Camelina sativa]XP_019084233.1 PREDICTED: dynamin-related protein 3B isoform X2 [Camelina sativa]
MSVDDLPPSPSASAVTPLGSSVIPIVNKLQDIFAQLGSKSTIQLPQVAVVGSQSSGKSSVLEALVGRDFLPRGNDICTRRPLVLQLLQTKPRSEGGSDEEWGEFLHHNPAKRIYDFSEIRREIEAETNRISGGNKGVSDNPIRLKISSPNVLDISLVDLPGITKVPVGDQPSAIEARIRTMILSYIKNPSCLILAVTPANSDLANSDALQIAGNADPDGHRTIGVITKLDIMDRGTDARNHLLGKTIPLRLGYVGVVNRSQEDILMNRSIKDALIAEEKFFLSRPAYSGLTDRLGVPQLAKKLNQILVQHIKAMLPTLKSRINSALFATAKEYESYGDIRESRGGQGALLLSFLTKYCEAYSSTLEGKSKEMSTSELSGGARILYIFQSVFVKSLEEVDPCEDLTDEDIRTAIQNATGPRSALFVPDVPFEVLVRRQISRLLDPSLQCARFIYDELIKISHQCMMTELQRFPVLQKRMDEVIGNFLREGLEPSQAMIRDLLGMEMDYINTSHPNFIGGTKAVELAMQQVKSSRIPHPATRPKDTVEPEKAASSASQIKTRSFLGRQANGNVTDQGVLAAADAEKSGPAGNTWTGLASMFRGSDVQAASTNNLLNKPFSEAAQAMYQNLSTIYLKEPPTVLRSSENHSEQESVEIQITKLLLKSYYDIVRKNVEDLVPKAIMHFLVNYSKRELHNVFIEKLYRENLIEELLKEPDELAIKRKRTQETLRILQQANRTLDELPLEAESVERGYRIGSEGKHEELPGTRRSRTETNGNGRF